MLMLIYLIETCEGCQGSAHCAARRAGLLFFIFIICLNEERVCTDVGWVTLTLILTLHLRANRLGTGDLVNLQITYHEDSNANCVTTCPHAAGGWGEGVTELPTGPEAC